MEHTIDAKNQKLGRLATQIASILQGKLDPAYQKNIVSKDKVIVVNANQVRIDGAKMDKQYVRYTGYPGGLLTESRKNVIARKGMKDVIEATVKNMLPKNKLQKLLLQKLEVRE